MIGPLRFLVSVGFGLVAWAVYYRVSIGPFCPAMWFGSAPPLVIGLASHAAYRALGRLDPR